MDDGAFESLINQPVNFFYGARDANCLQFTTVKEALIDILEGKWRNEVDALRAETNKKEREELKKQFIGITFSGTFDKRRSDGSLDKYSHIISIDVDKIKKIEQVRKILESAPFVFATFISPSGNGIKALAFSRMKSEHHKLLFSGIEDYFEKRDVIIDEKCKNLSRLCFVSYDPDLYCSYEGKRPFDLNIDAPEILKSHNAKKFVETKNPDYSRFEDSTNIQHIMETLKSWTKRSAGHYNKGNRNNFVFVLSCNLNRAGVPLELAISVMFENYPSLGRSEIESAVNSAYKHNKHEFGIRPVLKRRGLQNDLF